MPIVRWLHDTDFDIDHHSGICRCIVCNREDVAETGRRLPTQNRAQHPEGTPIPLETARALRRGEPNHRRCDMREEAESVAI